MRDLKKRLEALEANAKPRVISTVLDLINGTEDDRELSPELQKLVDQ